VGAKKKDVIQRIASDLDLSLNDAEQVYRTIIDELLQQLSKGKTVKLSGFGSFQVVSRQPKLGRNPRTGRRLQIPQHTSVKFKMGKNLIRTLNGNGDGKA
jgi:nucleoid DNA-binding protein